MIPCSCQLTTTQVIQSGETVMVEFHDPRGAAEVEQLSYGLGIELKAGATLGLLANGFPDSENFLQALSTELGKRVPGIKVRHWNKGNASIPANEEILAAIESNCDAAIAAYGH
jgi:hypothetical protein